MLDPSTVRLIQTEAIQLLEISVLLLLLNTSLYIAYKPFHEALQPGSQRRPQYFRTQCCIDCTGAVFKGTYIVDGFDKLKILHGFVPLGPEPADLRLDAVPDALGAGGHDPLAPVPAAGRYETKPAGPPRLGPTPRGRTAGADLPSRHLGQLGGSREYSQVASELLGGSPRNRNLALRNGKLSAAGPGQPPTPNQQPPPAYRAPAAPPAVGVPPVSPHLLHRRLGEPRVVHGRAGRSRRRAGCYETSGSHRPRGTTAAPPPHLRDRGSSRPGPGTAAEGRGRRSWGRPTPAARSRGWRGLAPPDSPPSGKEQPENGRLRGNGTARFRLKPTVLLSRCNSNDMKNKTIFSI